jgi:hypothetical protein
MRTSEHINELAAADAVARGEMTHAVLNKTNPHFRSRYADLASVMDATTPALSKHKLAIVQTTDFEDGTFVLITRKTHASGQWYESVYPIPHMPDKPQAMGSALSYARRYEWATMCGIASEEDDDGNAAQADTGKYGAISVRKSSAKAKRDGDWPNLQHEMADAQSAVSLQRLWDSYRQSEYAAWNADWRREAEELFEKRMAEFSAGRDLAETLEDSLEAELPATFAPNARQRAKAGVPEFVTPTAAQVEGYRERVAWLKGAKTAEELKERASNAEHLREVRRLTEGQVENLRAVYLDQVAAFQVAVVSAG